MSAALSLYFTPLLVIIYLIAFSLGLNALYLIIQDWKSLKRNPTDVLLGLVFALLLFFAFSFLDLQSDDQIHFIIFLFKPLVVCGLPLIARLFVKNSKWQHILSWITVFSLCFLIAQLIAPNQLQ